jgi:serine/threonine-protein kinase
MPEREPDERPGRSETAPVHPEAALELPATFGKYFLTEKLATGGMAEIYLGKLMGPGGFEKSLVIKQIHPRLSGQRHFVDLFVAEAKTLVTLTHGNIVPVYELGVIDDTYFIAMEYIDGPTLYRLTETLRRRGVRMEPAIAAWITARILEGLAYAHRKGDGVIHRDLSPRNVMMSRDGEVKLVDFGIAVTLGAAGEDDTGQSAPTGSFPYMSPEQVRKEPLTVQTDLFSVGVLCWEMLVGHRLFARPDPDATLHAVVEGDIARPSADHPDVPARLDEVVMRALERDMTTRWASADDMLAALQRYLYGLDETPGPRDVAALVARYCPPETRRLPTHHDFLEPEATRPRAWPPGPTTPSLPAPARPPR